jgi:hypothetical protein
MIASILIAASLRLWQPNQQNPFVGWEDPKHMSHYAFVVGGRIVRVDPYTCHAVVGTLWKDAKRALTEAGCNVSVEAPEK